MEFKRYANGIKFCEDNLEILVKEEALNTLMVGNAILSKEEDVSKWLLARVEQEGKTQMILLYMPGYHLLMYSPSNNESDKLFSFMAKEIHRTGIEIPGINSRVTYAEKFTKYYTKLQNKASKVRQEERILVLRKLKQVDLKEGNFIKAEESYREKVKPLFREFLEDAFGEKKEEKELDTLITKCIQRGHYILEKEGEIVSQARITKVVNSYRIGYVHTKRQHRGKGYAKTLVYLLTEKLLKEGADLVLLYTDATNPISNHLYETIGYEKISEELNIAFI